MVQGFASNDFDSAENWTDMLHDRDWAWWSGCHFHRYVKIDLQIESLPTSFWALKFVIEKAGGVIVYEGAWIDTQEMERQIQAGEVD